MAFVARTGGPGLVWLIGIPPAIGVGLFCGSTTNTPALGAAQEVLSTGPAG